MIDSHLQLLGEALLAGALSLEPEESTSSENSDSEMNLDSEANSTAGNDEENRDPEELDEANSDILSEEDDEKTDDESNSLSSEDGASVFKPELSPPLFQNSNINSHDFKVLFMSSAQKHNLTISSQSDILRFLNLTMLPPNQVPSSFYAMASDFVHFKAETIRHRYCGRCLNLLATGPCPKEECALSMERDAVFVELPLENQLKERFQGMLLTSILCIYVT